MKFQYPSPRSAILFHQMELGKTRAHILEPYLVYRAVHARVRKPRRLRRLIEMNLAPRVKRQLPRRLVARSPQPASAPLHTAASSHTHSWGKPSSSFPGSMRETAYRTTRSTASIGATAIGGPYVAPFIRHQQHLDRPLCRWQHSRAPSYKTPAACPRSSAQPLPSDSRPPREPPPPKLPQNAA